MATPRIFSSAGCKCNFERGRPVLAGNTRDSSGGASVHEKVIMTAEDVRRALVRVAHEVIERNRGADDLLFVGIMTRGVPLSRRIVVEIERFEGAAVPLGSLDISLYRDDMSRPGVGVHTVRKSDIPVDLTGKRVVLVDDVLFTGRSIRAAMDGLVNYGRPQLIQLAVLVDRGHRELPIRPDYVGKNVPTSLQEDVQVRVEEVDGSDSVVLRQLPADNLPQSGGSP